MTKHLIMIIEIQNKENFELEVESSQQNMLRCRDSNNVGKTKHIFIS